MALECQVMGAELLAGPGRPDCRAADCALSGAATILGASHDSSHVPAK